MLRRKPTDTALLDEIDLTLLTGVEQGLTFRALLQSVRCEAEEAQLRVLRLIHTGHLEGEPGDSAPPIAVLKQTAVTARPSAPVQSKQPITSKPPTRGDGVFTAATATRQAAPSSPVETTPQGRTVPPSARAARDALLRELSTRRSGTSYPPVRVSEPAPTIERDGTPGYYSMRGSAPPASAPDRSVISSAPPGRYSMGSDALSRGASSAPPHASDTDFDSPLAALIHEFSGGEQRERWCAARLRAALHEELSGNVQEAINVLEGVLVQVNDPRIRVERDRLQSRSLKATSGFYRSQALRAESADRHKEAAESWRKVLEAFPDDAEATLHAAKCSLDAGDLKRASVHARRAAELAPDSVAAHKVLLRFFRKTGMEHNANREREILRKLGAR